jgi:hypothetical protein
MPMNFSAPLVRGGERVRADHPLPEPGQSMPDRTVRYDRPGPANPGAGVHEAPLPRIAVCLPCYNEALAVAKVIADFRREMPTAAIYVYDNNSTDETCAIARAAGAIVRGERKQGKGHVLRRMFADIEADIYVICDADDSYDAAAVGAMLARFAAEGLDMVVGARVGETAGLYRPGHAFGNWMLSSLVRAMFGNEYRDMLSGYRVLSRRFVKSFPAMSGGFEIETELTIHALELEMPAAEVPIPFRERAEGSESKLRTFRDGCRILATIFRMLLQEKPLLTLSVVGAALAAASIGLSVPLAVTYARTGLVPRFPTAILSTSLMLLAFLCLFSGIILYTVTRGRQEAKRMRYLAVPGPHVARGRPGR